MKILVTGFIFENGKEATIENRKRLIINTDYKYGTQKMMEKVELELKNYFYNHLFIDHKNTLLSFEYNKEYNNFYYEQEGGGGAIKLEKIVEITVKK